MTENIPATIKTDRLKKRDCSKNDKREGEYCTYFKSGELEEKAVFKNGKLIGNFCFHGEQFPDASDGQRGRWFRAGLGRA